MKYYVLEGYFVENHPIGEPMEKAVKEHLQYLDPYFKNGTILVSGPKAGAGGGVIILKTDDIASFCDNDPFVKAGIQKYRITEFTVHDCQNIAQKWFES